jgi:hypothetical protein
MSQRCATDFDYRCEANRLTAIASTLSIAVNLDKTHQIDRVAIDAKYKLYDERRLSSGDVYQSFLYAYAYGNTSGHSIPCALVV